MDLLLTGAGGQLGHEVARQAAVHGLSIRAFARAELDITDRTAVDGAVGALKPKVIVNAAAYTAVDKAESDRAAAFAVNCDGPAHLAGAAERHGAAILHVSTDYVFDGTKQGAYVETDPVAPLGAYGESKEAGEAAVRAATDRHIILRTAWVFGAHGSNFVKTMLRLGRERDQLRVVDDQTGCPTYAADLAEVVLHLARRVADDAMPQDGFGTFHCAAGPQTTWCGFARTIFELSASRLGKVPQVQAIPTSAYPTPAKRPANSALDCSRLQRVHGLDLPPWPDALGRMLDRLDREA